MNFYKYFLKNKDNYLLNYKNKKISYKDVLNFKNKKITFENKIILIVSNNQFDTIFTYLIFLISRNSVILVDGDLEKEFLADYIYRYKPDYIAADFLYKFDDDKIKFELNITKTLNLFKINHKIKKYLNTANKLLLSTSGSTGSPKMVRLSEENLLQNALSIKKYLKIKKKDKCITTLPPTYSYGVSIINSHIISGASIEVNNYNILDERFWKLVKKKKISSLSFVPSQYDTLAKLRFLDVKINSIKYLTSAGGKIKNITLQLISEFCRKNKKDFFIMYGQTEASPRMSYYKIKKNKKEQDNNCIGKAIPGGKLSIKNPNSRGEGEILYKGKNVFLGYANDYKDLKKGRLNKGILATGDLGYKDEKGFFFITTRKKRIVKINSVRISLDHIEEIFKNKKIIIKCFLKKDILYINYFKLSSRIKIMKYLQEVLNIDEKYYKLNYIKNYKGFKKV